LLGKLKELDAESGTAVLMEVKTGNIKAITNMGRIREGVWGETKNYAVSDMSEPGSTFKVASMMVALDDNLVKPNDPVKPDDPVKPNDPVKPDDPVKPNDPVDTNNDEPTDTNPQVDPKDDGPTTTPHFIIFYTEGNLETTLQQQPTAEPLTSVLPLAPTPLSLFPISEPTAFKITDTQTAITPCTEYDIFDTPIALGGNLPIESQQGIITNTILPTTEESYTDNWLPVIYATCIALSSVAAFYLIKHKWLVIRNRSVKRL